MSFEGTKILWTLLSSLKSRFVQEDLTLNPDKKALVTLEKLQRKAVDRNSHV